MIQLSQLHALKDQLLEVRFKDHLGYGKNHGFVHGLWIDLLITGFKV